MRGGGGGRGGGTQNLEDGEGVDSGQDPMEEAHGDEAPVVEPQSRRGPRGLQRQHHRFYRPPAAEGPVEGRHIPQRGSGAHSRPHPKTAAAAAAATT